MTPASRLRLAAERDVARELMRHVFVGQRCICGWDSNDTTQRIARTKHAEHVAGAVLAVADAVLGERVEP